MAEELARAHLFAILPEASFHDGLPNVVLEALARGRPVIVSDLPAASEAVERDVNGAILAMDDLEDGFAELCHRILTEPTLLARWSAAAAPSVQGRHDKRRQLQFMRGLLSGEDQSEHAA
jgi:glycosyltransferase involved in cell wall biosynthesis